MTSIRETISTVLPSDIARGNSYIVDQAVAALTDREYALSDQITGQVVAHFGVSEEQVKVALEDIGMAVRPAPEPEPEVEEVAAKQGKGKGKGLKARVKRLEKLAREHGLLSR